MNTSTRTTTVGFRDERGPILVAIMLSIGLMAISTTILATSVPTLVADLGDFERFPWLFSIFMLAQAVSVPIYSKLADQLGRKPMILIGISIFLFGSLLCGFAWDMTSLIVFRAIQGLGGGAILPISVTILGDIYSIAERGRVQGYTGTIWAASAVLGPTLGGVFVQFVSWRWIFFVNVPLSLLAMWQLSRFYKEKVERKKRRIDFLGAGILTIALSALILGLLEGGNSWEWLSPMTFIMFGIAAVSVALFIYVELRVPDPILDMGLMKRPMIWSTALVSTCIGGLTIGISSYGPVYLENSTGILPIFAGLAVASMTLAWPIASTTSTKLYMRWGFRRTAMLGSAVAITGALALALVAPWPNPFVFAVFAFVAGFGFGWTATPILVAAQSSVEWEERGAASGTNSLSRAIGSALGVAVFGAIANSIVSAGSGSQDFDTITAAGQAVFFAAAGAAVLQFIGSSIIPRKDSTRVS